MKYSIWCVLFGHKWCGWNGYGTGVLTLVFVNHCVRCGLSKEEVGITNTKN